MGEEGEVRIGRHKVPTKEVFKYLGSIIQANRKDITHCIRVGWQKWRNTAGVLCDRRVPLKFKANSIGW